MGTAPAIAAYRYLVVDDDTFTCDCFVKLLRKLNAAEVNTIHNGKAAIEWIEKTPSLPDIIICDLNMPELDGVEYVLYLSQKKFTGGIILVSGTAIQLLNAVMHLADAHKLNILGALSKPIATEEFIALLSRFNGQRQPDLSPLLAVPKTEKQAKHSTKP